MTRPNIPNGVWPVMLTPFQNDRSIDWHALEALTEWYLQMGVSGLFADAQSAEVYQLTNDEKLKIASTVVRCVNGRVPVIAGGYASGSMQEQATFFRRMADTGVELIVLTTSQLAATPPADQEWIATTEEFLTLTDPIPLGLYEMPTPYQRLLTPEMMGWLASTKRFFFHKDTSCNAQAIALKIDAIRGSELRFFNADTPTLPASLRAGGNGFSGIGANFVPDLYVWLCNHFEDEPEKAEKVYGLLHASNVAMHRKYPAIAKVFLRLRGLGLTGVCRGSDRTFTDADEKWLAEFLEASEQIGLELQPQESRVSG